MVPSIQDGGGREALIEMARVWLRLAERYAEASSTKSAAADTTQPVMQQQQQVPPDKSEDKD
jgi:cob(I)alamin adenosyltransferase